MRDVVTDLGEIIVYDEVTIILIDLCARGPRDCVREQEGMI